MSGNAHTLSQTTKWLITVTVMLVAVMEVLDITIVNVAMREMMGTFGATITQITWVITAYVVASAIVMPLTGFLVENFGRRRILLVNILGFLITSALCGISNSLFEIIIFRALQGIFGASLIPLSQFILRDTFTKKELGKAMAVWAMGIMVGPILGPTLGGYITESLSWHWVFFINIPVCIVAFVLTLTYIKETPTKKMPVDWFGITALAVGIGALQTFLEEGHHYDWFASTFIVALFVAAVFGVSAFIIRSMNNPHSVIKMSIFKDRQFVSCTLLMLLYPMILFGAIVLQPLMSEVLMQYPPQQAGLIMAPRGLASLLFMPFIPVLAQRFGAKIIIAIGFLVTAYGTYLMSQWNLQINMGKMAWEGVVQGIGMSMVFGPLSTIVFDNLPPEDIASAAGMFSFARNIGMSIGIAMFTTVLTQQTQINWNRLGGHINAMNPNLWHWLNVQHTTMQNPVTVQNLAHMLSRQANMIGYINVYWLASILFLGLIPLVLLIKRSRINLNSMGAH
jgi:DHA2 family multidrug resistance protein